MTSAHLIPALLSCLGGCATTKPQPPTATGNPAKWTVMVYMNAKNDLERFSVENYDQMKKVGSTDDVNILVDYGRPDHHYDKRYGAWSSTVRFRVKKGVDPLLANGKNMGKVDMGSASELRSFVDWSMKQYPAEHYALVIWDHGQGFRLFDRTQLAADAVAPPARETESSFKSVSWDEDKRTIMYNADIQKKLASLLGGKKLDVIGFDACLMAMVETGYAMRNVARFLVASEELEPGEGWNYQTWLQPLVRDPTMDDRSLSKLMVSAYRDSHSADKALTMAVIDLGQMPALATSLAALTDLLMAGIDRYLTVISTARDACDKYNLSETRASNGIDLVRFLEQLDTLTQDESLRQRILAAAAATKAAIVEHYASTKRQGRYGSFGLAIYFPQRKAVFDADADRDGYLKPPPRGTPFPVEFVQTQPWPAFLTAYLGRRP